MLIVVVIVGASQGNELSTALDKVGFSLSYIAIILKRKSLKGINALGPIEFKDFKLSLSFT